MQNIEVWVEKKYKTLRHVHVRVDLQQADFKTYTNTKKGYAPSTKLTVRKWCG